MEECASGMPYAIMPADEQHTSLSPQPSKHAPSLDAISETSEAGAGLPHHAASSSADTHHDTLFDTAGEVSSTNTTPTEEDGATNDASIEAGPLYPAAHSASKHATHVHYTETERGDTNGEASTPPAHADRLDYAPTDVHSDTPGEPMQYAAPLPRAVQLVQSGVGQLSVVHAGESETEIRSHVVPGTTHLSMKDCLIPRTWFDILAVPASLVVLDIGGTGLDRLPDALAYCYALEELNVSHNALGASSEAWAPLSELRQLRVLLMDECKLRKVPSAVGGLRQLHVLSARGNMLTHLPSWFYLLDKVECVLLEGNETITPAWRAILAPLFRSDETDDATEVVAHEPGPDHGVRVHDGRKRSLFQRAMRRPSQRNPNDRGAEAGPSEPRTWRLPHWPTPEAARVQGMRDVATPAVGRTLRSIVVPLSHTGPTSHAPLPSLGESMRTRGWGAPASAASLLGYPTIPCFLPAVAYVDEHGVVLATTAQSSYLADLRDYLHDMDDLLPQRHIQHASTNLAEDDTSSVDSIPLTPGTSSFHGSSSFIVEAIGSTNSASTTRSAEYEGAISVVSPMPLASAVVPDVSDAKDDARKRRRLIYEILETERTYVVALNELLDIYVRRARGTHEGQCDERMLPLAKERAVFGHIEGIVHFHTCAFLPSLEAAAAEVMARPEAPMDDQALAEVAVRVANVFTEHAVYFKMYMNYVNQYDSAVRRIARWSTPISTRRGAGLKPVIENASMTLATLGHRLHLNQSEPAPSTSTRPPANDWEGLPIARRRQIQGYLHRCREDYRHSQLNLEGYLLLPIQRIPRYRLLLEQLVRCTTGAGLPPADADAIPRALAHISLVASWVNEGKRLSEQGRRLLVWQSKLRGHFSAPLVQPHRRLICDGTLRLLRVTRRAEGDEFAHAGVLEQTIMDQRVQLLLCNDLAVVVALPRHVGSDVPPAPPRTASADATDLPRSSLDPADVEAMELMAVLKPTACRAHAPESGSVVPPASVINQVHLRVVDAKYIFYFIAYTPLDAQRWAHAINDQLAK